MARPVFGSLKYQEIARLTQRLKIAKTDFDKKLIQRQLDFLQGEINKEESESERFFKKM